jgi:predicted Rossmann fold flavoprotein
MGFEMNRLYDVVIIGAGAAGLMCAHIAASRGQKVLILEKSNKPGKKILMSGGGRCNFTNTNTTYEKFISHNIHFCKSALSRYTQFDFISLVKSYKIAYFEKTLGQLFCEEKSSLILHMLLSECEKHNVSIKYNQDINIVKKDNELFAIYSSQDLYKCKSLVIATGGLSIPTLGSSPFGYNIAKQFGLKVHPLKSGLVPFTLHDSDKERFKDLTGISIDCLVSCNKQSFRENILFTHRGVSGPAILQISSYWNPGDIVEITNLPNTDIYSELINAKRSKSDAICKTILAKFLAKKILNVFLDENSLNSQVKSLTDIKLADIANKIQHWTIKPNATEGYRTAEVTLGGVDCDEISSKTFEAHKVPGLYFIGEVLDVTGWLGGYNFQWAWSSAWAAGQVV